jgi:hypothetical protein
METRQPDILAEIKFQKQGRIFHSGYIPATKFDGSELLTSGKQKFVGKEKTQSGETLNAFITIISIDAFKGFLFPGQKIYFYEGDKLMGSGKILKVLNSYLEKNN